MFLTVEQQIRARYYLFVAAGAEDGAAGVALSPGRSAPLDRLPDRSGALRQRRDQKNIEVQINRRFKRQGRSWSRAGAEHLAQLLWLQSHPKDWNHWWLKTALTKTKVNPGWPSSPRPPN